MQDRSVRRGVLVGIGVVALVAVVAALTARGASPAPAKAPGAASAQPGQNSCSVCLERNPVLDPAKYAGWNDADVAKAYIVAQQYPATIDLLHCFCECEESPKHHHKTLLTCFTTDHGASCGICQHEALLAGKLKREGASDEEVENVVESLMKTDGHPPTKGRGL